MFETPGTLWTRRAVEEDTCRLGSERRISRTLERVCTCVCGHTRSLHSVPHYAASTSPTVSFLLIISQPSANMIAALSHLSQPPRNLVESLRQTQSAQPYDPCTGTAHSNTQNLSRTKSSDSKSKSPSPSSSRAPAGPSGSNPNGPRPGAAGVDTSNLAPGSQGQGQGQGLSPTGTGGNASLSAGGPNAAGQGATAGPTTPRRSPVSDKTSPAPPLVVISGAQGPGGPNSEMPSDPITHSPGALARGFGSPERMLGPDGQPTPPRAGPLNRLRGTPKDTIPIAGKTPRKQRSSRFYVTEKVDIEKLPNFLGMYLSVGSRQAER